MKLKSKGDLGKKTTDIYVLSLIWWILSSYNLPDTITVVGMRRQWSIQRLCTCGVKIPDAGSVNT